MARDAKLAAVDKRERVDAEDMIQALGRAGIDHELEVATTHGSGGPVAVYEADKLARVGLDREHVSKLGFGDGVGCDVHTPPSFQRLRTVAIREINRLRYARNCD